MNPDKLFDYLDGKLSPADRQEVEDKLMSDEQLRREFKIAREIHRGGGDKREVVVPPDDPAVAERGARLGRRIATAAVVLVFLNVVIGLGVITIKNRKSSNVGAREAEIRRQLAASLGAAAQSAMPTPSFSAGEILISVPRPEWENVTSRVMAGAEAFGGSAARGLPDGHLLTIVVDIPSSRESEFRHALTSAAAISPMPAIAPTAATETSAPNERTILQVRLAEAAR